MRVCVVRPRGRVRPICLDRITGPAGRYIYLNRGIRHRRYTDTTRGAGEHRNRRRQRTRRQITAIILDREQRIPFARRTDDFHAPRSRHPAPGRGGRSLSRHCTRTVHTAPVVRACARQQRRIHFVSATHCWPLCLCCFVHAKRVKRTRR